MRYLLTVLFSLLLGSVGTIFALDRLGDPAAESTLDRIAEFLPFVERPSPEPAVTEDKSAEVEESSDEAVEPPVQLLLRPDLMRRDLDTQADEQLSEDLVRYVALRRIDGPWALNANGIQRYALDEDYAYLYEETCEIIAVPEGFVSDFASIPPAARALFNPANYPEPSLVHDWLYAVGTPGDEEARKKADQVFRAMLVESLIPSAETFTIFRSVRAGGGEGFGLDEDYMFFDFERRRLRPGGERPENPYLPYADASQELKDAFDPLEHSCG